MVGDEVGHSSRRLEHVLVMGTATRKVGPHGSTRQLSMMESAGFPKSPQRVCRIILVKRETSASALLLQSCLMGFPAKHGHMYSETLNM